MRIALTSALSFLVFATTVADDVRAQNLSLGASAGTSYTTGEGSEFWNTGYNIGGQLFFSLNKYFSLGGHIAYNGWGLNEDDALKEFIPDGTVEVFVFENSGSLSSVELTGDLRLSSGEYLGERLTGFLQFGGGVYTLSIDTKINAGWNFDGSGSATDGAMLEVEESETKGGINFGGGLSFTLNESISIDFYSLYHSVFTTDETTNYFSVSAGLSFTPVNI